MSTSSRHPNTENTTPALMSDGGAQPSTLPTPGIARWLALGAVAGPIVFTVAWFALGFVSPGFTLFGTRIAPYSPISAGISGLGLGPTAPYMNGAFALCGILIIAGAVGIFQGIPELGASARWGATVLLALPGLGSVMDGIFTLESFLLHFVGFALACTTVVGFPVAGLALRRIPRWHRFGSWLLLGGPLTLALVLLYFLTFSPTVAGAESGVAGLTERILTSEMLAWYVALGWLAFRSL